MSETLVLYLFFGTVFFLFGTVFLFFALYFDKIALFLANQNREIFSMYIINLV